MLSLCYNYARTKLGQMFITTHAAIATIAGTQIANPIFAFIAGVILHFAFDIIPTATAT